MEAPSNEIEEEETTPEIISFDQGNDKVKANHSTLGKVMSDIHKNEKVIIISVLGQPRSGKSFIANWVAKYLKYNGGENGDHSWIGNDDDKLEGFKWNPNLSEEMVTEGNGIRTFKHSIKLPGVSILVLDIDLKVQSGTMTNQENKQHQRNYHTLVSTCTMISSLIIWIENGQQALEEEAEMEFRSILEIFTKEIHEHKKFDKPRNVIFVLNQYFPHQNPDKLKDIPIANSEFLRTKAVTLPNLLNSKSFGYFQGEAKYMNKHELNMVIQNIVPINELLAVTNETVNKVKDVIDIIQKAVDMMNQALGNTQLDLELEANVPPLGMEEPTVKPSKSEIDLGVVNRLEENVSGCEENSTQQQIKSFQSTVDKEPDANLPTGFPKPQRTQNSIAIYQNKDQLNSSTVPSNPKCSTEQIITFVTGKIRQTISTNIKALMLSAHSRNCLLVHLNEIILTKYIAAMQAEGYDMETITTVQEAAKDSINHLLEYFKPITTSLSISLLIIESEFDSRIYFEDENELLELINSAKLSSARKFKSIGSPSQLEKLFDECWTVISDNFICRNRKVCQYENNIELKLVEMVLVFYNIELNSIVVTSRSRGQHFQARVMELKNDTFKIMQQLLEFSRNKSKVLKVLEDRIANVFKGVGGQPSKVENSNQAHVHCSDKQNCDTPMPAPVNHHLTSTTGKTYSAVAAGASKNTIVSNRPAARKPKQISVSTPTTASKPDALLILHLSRGDEFKYAFIQQEFQSSSFVKKTGNTGKFIGFADGEFVLNGNRNGAFLDIGNFKPGDTKVLPLGNGKEIIFGYEEAFGLLMAKLCSTVNEASVNKFVVIIPLMTSIIERHAIQNAANCAGFNEIHFVTETTAVGAHYLFCDTSWKLLNDYQLVIFLSKTKDVEFAVQTTSKNKLPKIRTESVSGSKFRKQLSSSWWPSRKYDDEKYLKDALHLARISTWQVLRSMVIAGDSVEAYRSIEGNEFNCINRTMNFTDSLFNGAINLTLFSLNELVGFTSLVIESLPFEVALKTAAGRHVLFGRATPLPSKATLKIEVPYDSRVISFDVTQQIGKEESVIGNYSVSIDGEVHWNVLEITVEIDSYSLLNVRGTLNIPKLNGKCRDVIVEKNDSFNIKAHKIPSVKEKIKSWLTLSEDKQIKIHLIELFKLYIDNFKTKDKNVDASMKEIIRSSVDNIICILNSNDEFNKQALKLQLSFLEKIEDKLPFEIGKEEIAKMQELLK